MDCFDALQGAPRALKRTIALGEPDSFLHQAMILLDHIIQVLALTQGNATRQRTFGFQRLDGCRIAPQRGAHQCKDARAGQKVILAKEFATTSRWRLRQVLRKFLILWCARQDSNLRPGGSAQNPNLVPGPGGRDGHFTGESGSSFLRVVDNPLEASAKHYAVARE